MVLDKEIKKKNIIFWGAGKIGHDILNEFEKYHIKPDYFCSKNEESIGKEINGIRIISHIEALNLRNSIYFITCWRYMEIYDQLIRNGIKKENIILANGVFSFQLQCLLFESFYKKGTEYFRESYTQDGVIIDLNFGCVLGGVEDWSTSLVSVFNSQKIKCLFLLPKDGNCRIHVDKKFNIAKSINFNCVEECIINILKTGFNNIICNFPYEIFTSACIIKKYFNHHINIIAVIHNDEEIYYETYCKCSQYIDLCVVISKTIRDKLIRNGFPEKKIINLNWFIPICINTERKYFLDNKLHIGYAGRINTVQKRHDLFLEIAEILKKNKVNFVIELAGIGEYMSEMKIEVSKRNLDKYFIFRGFISHDLIHNFWNEMDICLMTSEYEGHSISVSEAMACGVVPVVTNTSGVEDDVQNGYNGFVSDIGDIKSMVKNIDYIYNNPNLLSTMGKRCIAKIEKNNQGTTIYNFDKLIRLTGCE